MICNGGTDTVIADTLDTISPSCENVQVAGHARAARSTTAPPTLAWAAPAAGAAITANAATMLSVNAADDRGRHEGPVLRRRPPAVRGHRGAVQLRVPAARRRRRPQHADRDRHRRGGPDGERRARDHRPPLRARGRDAHAQAEPRPPRPVRLPARAARSAAPTPSRRRRAARGTVSITAKRGTKTISTQARLGLDAHVRVPVDVHVQDAHREPACASRRSSAATTCSRRPSSKTRTARLG